MVEARITYLGDLRCEAVHDPSGSKLLTDAPTDNMGRGEFFSPTDLVAAGLGACILTVMGIVAQRHRIDLSGATAIVRKEMTSQPTRRIGRLAVELHVPARVADQDRKILERAARTCPVHGSLHPDVQIELKWRWGD